MFKNKNTGDYKWGTAIIVCLAVFVIVLDVSALNVAITRLMHDLNASLATIRTLIAFYALIIASCMITTSKIQDVIGRKKTFLVGLIIFSIGTIISSLSINAEMLFIGWAVLEGTGAALIFPVTTSILRTSYEGKDQVTAFGLWGGIASMGAAIGPIFGGFFTSFFTWRFTFLSEFILVIIIFLFTYLIKDSKGFIKWKDFDFIGAALSIISLILIVLGILLLNYPIYWNYVPILLVIGLVLFTVFLWSQSERIKKGLEPLSDVTLFKKRVFTLGNINFILQQIPLAGFLFITPVFLEQALNLGAFNAGLVILPSSITLMIFAILGAKLSNNIPHKYVLIMGYIIAALGAWILGDQYFVGTTIYNIIPATVLYGVGLGLLASQLTEFIMSAANPKQNTDAAGMLNSLKNLGYSLGTALIGVVFIFAFVGAISTSLADSSLGHNLTKDQIDHNILSSLEKNTSLNSANITSTIAPNEKNIINHALDVAMKSIFNFLTILLIIGAIITIFFIKKKDGENN